MSHFNIDKAPPPVRAPNREAIQDLDRTFAERKREERRQRSLQTCHRPALRPALKPYNERSEAFVPQCSARLINDPGLSDGARRCALKIIELVYRRHREDRQILCTVNYLAKCLGRSQRTVQYYLAQLRSRGYIRHDVIASERARMCVGIVITLLKPIFPKHEWPVQAKPSKKSGVQRFSQRYTPNIERKRFQERVSVEDWAWRCMEGVYRALLSSRSGLSLPETGQPAALRCLA